jgi:biotin synthase-related radical SAM superfamily protein
MRDYPCCECCLTDSLHPDHHEASCPTCNNPAADRLLAELTQMREERDDAQAQVERLMDYILSRWV